MGSLILIGNDAFAGGAVPLMATAAARGAASCASCLPVSGYTNHPNIYDSFTQADDWLDGRVSDSGHTWEHYGFFNDPYIEGNILTGDGNSLSNISDPPYSAGRKIRVEADISYVYSGKASLPTMFVTHYEKVYSNNVAGAFCVINYRGSNGDLYFTVSITGLTYTFPAPQYTSSSATTTLGGFGPAKLITIYDPVAQTYTIDLTSVDPVLYMVVDLTLHGALNETDLIAVGPGEYQQAYVDNLKVFYE